MKKYVTTFFVLLTLLMSLSVASAYRGYDISNSDWDHTYQGIIPKHAINDRDYAYGKYPLVGASEAGTYYLDTSSCTYYIDGNVAVVSCIAYKGSGGAAPDGSPAKMSPDTYKFATAKQDGQRVIFLLSIAKNSNGDDETQWILKQDNGYLKNLFWETADHSGLSKSLD